MRGVAWPGCVHRASLSGSCSQPRRRWIGSTVPALAPLPCAALSHSLALVLLCSLVGACAARAMRRLHLALLRAALRVVPAASPPVRQTQHADRGNSGHTQRRTSTVEGVEGEEMQRGLHCSVACCAALQACFLMLSRRSLRLRVPVYRRRCDQLMVQTSAIAVSVVRERGVGRTTRCSLDRRCGLLLCSSSRAALLLWVLVG